METYYKISEKNLKKLLYNSIRLELLDMGGVDNWEWYGENWHDFLLEMTDDRIKDQEILDDITIDDIVELDIMDYEKI